MNRNIVQLANALLVGFLIAAGFLFYWQVVNVKALTSNASLNLTRLMDAENNMRRGLIVDRDGNVLAKSEQSADWPTRVYTTPSLVHVVGYHSARFGSSAIEDSFNDYLSGERGNDSPRLLQARLLHQPVSGTDVVLTIDSRLQKVADEALGSDPGAIVAMNPRTGEILAMTSHPYFDPNTMEQNWERILNNEGKPLINRATQGLYAPGSTFKTVTLTAALEAGVTRPDELFRYQLKVNERGERYHDLLVQGYRVYDANHGPTDGDEAILDLAHAYAVSCNVAFADLGLRLGARRLTEAAARFGFGTEAPIEIGGVASLIGSNGVIAKGDPALAATAFGQGELAVTPLQMVLVAAAVANDGVVPKPHIVQAVRNQSGEVWRAVPEQWRRAMGTPTAKTVAAMMVTSAEEGWAKTGQIAGVRVAAKTGTAETGAGGASHAWFIAFAPADNPQVAVAVIKERAGGGASRAGPAAKAVMEAALRIAPR